MLSEVRVSQGVEEAAPEETGATLEGVATTGTLLEAGVEACSELVATGTAVSEVRVSQGVELEAGPLLELSPLGMTGVVEGAALLDMGTLEGAGRLEDEPEPEPEPPMIRTPLRSIPVSQLSRVRRMLTSMSMSAAPPRTAAS